MTPEQWDARLDMLTEREREIVAKLTGEFRYHAAYWIIPSVMTAVYGEAVGKAGPEAVLAVAKRLQVLAEVALEMQARQNASTP